MLLLECSQCLKYSEGTKNSCLVNDQAGIKIIFLIKSIENSVHELLQGINKHHKKFQAKIRSGKAATGPRPFFAIPYTGKNHKMAFSGFSFHFLVLEPFSSNINRRKALSLFLFSKV